MILKVSECVGFSYLEGLSLRHFCEVQKTFSPIIIYILTKAISIIYKNIHKRNISIELPT